MHYANLLFILIAISSEFSIQKFYSQSCLIVVISVFAKRIQAKENTSCLGAEVAYKRIYYSSVKVAFNSIEFISCYCLRSKF